ncbi:MAG: ATP-grasp domain-containing protein [Ferruginibacter sp.]
MKIGLVTYDTLPQLAPGEQALIPILAAKGIEAVGVVWSDAAVHWQQFDALVIRSVWDSHLKPVEFAQWLNTMKALSINVFNSVDTILFNLHKFYLRDLAKRGVPIVPTIFIEKQSALHLNDIWKHQWKQAVIKPAISAGAFLTEIFTEAGTKAIEEKYETIVQERDLLIQPFMQEVHTLGELSFIFFNKQFSHAVLKKPTKNDFRVQEIYGGQTIPYTPSLQEIDAATKIVHCIPEALLYARVDGVMVEDEFVLMELELIEPDLFLSHHPQAVENFANAIEAIV